MVSVGDLRQEYLERPSRPSAQLAVLARAAGMIRRFAEAAVGEAPHGHQTHSGSRLAVTRKLDLQRGLTTLAMGVGVNLFDVMVIIVVIEMRPGGTDYRLRASVSVHRRTGMRLPLSVGSAEGAVCRSRSIRIACEGRRV
jgi:hypothetical protein